MKTTFSVIPLAFILALCRIASAAQSVAPASDPQFSQASATNDFGALPGLPGNSDILLAPNGTDYDTNPHTTNTGAGIYQVGLETGFSFVGPANYTNARPSIFGDMNCGTSGDTASPGSLKPALAGFDLTPHETELLSIGEQHLPATNFNFSQNGDEPVRGEAKVVSFESNVNELANFNLSEAQAATVPGLTQAVPEPGVCVMVVLGTGMLLFARRASFAKVRRVAMAQA